MTLVRGTAGVQVTAACFVLYADQGTCNPQAATSAAICPPGAITICSATIRNRGALHGDVQAIRQGKRTRGTPEFPPEIIK
jgi:hypothetical protein